MNFAYGFIVGIIASPAGTDSVPQPAACRENRAEKTAAVRRSDPILLYANHSSAKPKR